MVHLPWTRKDEIHFNILRYFASQRDFILLLPDRLPKDESVNSHILFPPGHCISVTNPLIRQVEVSVSAVGKEGNLIFLDIDKPRTLPKVKYKTNVEQQNH